MTTKEIIFFLLIFILFYLLSKCSLLCSSSLKIGSDVSLLFGGLLMTIFILSIYYIANIHECKDGFTFEVSPVKRCCGGPYTYSSNPNLKAFCDKISPEQKEQVCCNKGFTGIPKT